MGIEHTANHTLGGENSTKHIHYYHWQMELRQYFSSTLRDCLKNLQYTYMNVFFFINPALFMFTRICHLICL